MRWLALAVVLAGCAELGMISDGTSISVGKPNRGYLIGGVRLPDRGDGFLTRSVWQARGNRFGTDELVDLLTAVARRMQHHAGDVPLVIADLSGQGGGAQASYHRSHQTGRDVDILYYMRDAAGQPLEPDAMRKFNVRARAADGSGITVDIPRTWLLVKELVTAPEAMVQWVFMYEPIAYRVIEHARAVGEPEALVIRARRALRQPGDSARHDDHLHVRVYCAEADRGYGCVDIGPMEMLAERQAEPSPLADLLSALTQPPAVAAAPPSIESPTAASALPGAAATAGPAATITPPPSFGRVLRTRIAPAALRTW
jgi:penicillin-insensitive murein DD-endopeptidase